LFCLVLAVLAAFAGWRLMQASNASDKAKPLPELGFRGSEVLLAARDRQTRVLEVSGQIAAPDAVVFRAKGAGLLRELAVREGQWVLQGQMLEQHDLSELQAGRAECEAALAAGRSALELTESQGEANRRLADRRPCDALAGSAPNP